MARLAAVLALALVACLGDDIDSGPDAAVDPICDCDSQSCVDEFVTERLGCPLGRPVCLVADCGGEAVHGCSICPEGEN